MKQGDAMNASADSELHSLKSKTSYQGAHLPNAVQHSPVTFFLRSGSEMEKSMAQAGDTDIMEHSTSSFVEDESVAASVASTSFGVESLEDTIAVSTSPLSTSPRATNSIHAGMKRKPGNPVHPKIYATGQRIVSSDLSSSMLSALSNSPPKSHVRRTSLSSSAHLTPLNISPAAHGTEPGTPRTNSMKSFKLSDEEASVTSDTPSQAIQSSTSDEDVIAQQSTSIVSGAHRESELVMPSIAVPTRRPFTQRGRNFGQMRVMVVGGKGLGKSSLLKSIFKHCEDIVHVDGISPTSSVVPTSASRTSVTSSTSSIQEFQASTKPLPSWWSNMDSSRAWWRRKSVSESVLDRNLRFVDTPAIEDRTSALSVLNEIDQGYARLVAVDTMAEAQLLDLISGRADGIHDVVLYLLPGNEVDLMKDELHLMHELCRRTNVIPILSQADTIDPEDIPAVKERLFNMLTTAKVNFCSMSRVVSGESQSTLPFSPQDVFAVSSLANDGDVMDASTLMASDYLPQLADSDLHVLIQAIFNPPMAAQLRHQAISKYILWRREHVAHSDPATQGLLRPPRTHALTSTGSLMDDPSKAAVSAPYSSYYRSTSPSGSDSSDVLFGLLPGAAAGPADILSNAEPSRHIHIAKWARDLRRSLRMDGTGHNGLFVRPAKGRLGGELGIVDPKDPLGLSSLSQALGRHGWLTLQLVGGCGLMTAAVWWFSRNWIEMQEWLWPAQPYATPVAVGAPVRSWMDNLRLL